MSVDKNVFTNDKVIPYPYDEGNKVWIGEHEKYEKYKDDIKFDDPVEEWNNHTICTPKICSKCSQEKLLCYFATNTSGRDPFTRDGYRNRRPECKDCSKKEGNTCKKAMQKSKKEGKPTKAPPGTTCELCGKSNKIVYDHDHETCTFRGWLCDPCNRGLGQCGDNIEGLMKRVNYLLSKKDMTDIPKIIQNSETGLLDVL